MLKNEEGKEHNSVEQGKEVDETLGLEEMVVPEIPLREESVNDEQHVIQPIFRSAPIEKLSNLDVYIMLKEKGFFDSQSNKSASGFSHTYVLQKEAKVVYDRASGLMWQLSGSNNGL